MKYAVSYTELLRWSEFFTQFIDTEMNVSEALAFIFALRSLERIIIAGLGPLMISPLVALPSFQLPLLTLLPATDLAT